MSDTITVREACEHGFYLMHPLYTMPGSAGPTLSCPGGREITLRRVCSPDGKPVMWSLDEVWLMEVDDAS